MVALFRINISWLPGFLVVRSTLMWCVHGVPTTFLSLSRLRSEHRIFLFFHLFFLTLPPSYVGSPCSKTWWLFLVLQWWHCELTHFIWAANHPHVYGGFIDILHCRGAMTFSITTFSIMTLSIKGLIVTLSINDIQDKWHTTYKTLSITKLSLCCVSHF